MKTFKICMLAIAVGFVGCAHGPTVIPHEYGKRARFDQGAVFGRPAVLGFPDFAVRFERLRVTGGRGLTGSVYEFAILSRDSLAPIDRFSCFMGGVTDVTDIFVAGKRYAAELFLSSGELIIWSPETAKASNPALYRWVWERDHGKAPNKAPEPTTLLVTPRAGARVAPSRVVAHL